MASVNIRQETIKRPLDECPCDWCEIALLVGETAFLDLEHGTAYCSAACAEHDAFDSGYGPVCPGVGRW